MKKTAYDIFTQVFEIHLKEAPTNTEAYYRAENQFETDYGFCPYSSYNSYRMVRANKIKKSKKLAERRR